jgi:DNA-binding CsgD family transcriptional regulator
MTPAQADFLSRLSKRERELVLAIIDGGCYSYKTVAEVHGISVDTVKRHMSHVRTKLGADNVIQIVVLYFNAKEEAQNVEVSRSNCSHQR